MNKKLLTLLFISVLAVLALVGCGAQENGNTSNNTDSKSGSANEGKKADTSKITVVWYPNESGNELKGSRDALGALIKDATGREVEHKLTTDYAIAIETIANGNAHVAFMGAQGYIEANNKSKDVQALVVPSGKSGTLDDAVYYSWLAVPKDKAEEYKTNGEFDVDKIAGKRFSFVSASSTSGFKVPSTSIISHFGAQEEYKDLTAEDLAEPNALFPEVLFGDSHQGSAVNMLMERSDVSAFCDTCVNNYVEVVEGKANTVGAVYRVKDDAEAPFNNLVGKEFVLISVTPVLNAPFVVNESVLTADEIAAIEKAFTSDETANNEEVFVPKGSDTKGLFSKSDGGNERFVSVEDEWFDPIRDLSK
ncbi:PhnD/SsuA/transferrin family substrate-binding protein [Ureibacillus manganicus]|uniref:Phosphonate ABC transporter substrate-binding protein n=1 Tax=Ureibacillus manganicus DSM 26584 TaxID=1384049 RepID=A0A0A3IX04_9BACL|nr:PhnD/SsuA/transferrin family substrate-binding protein [Ureibacillus manganicus]KGR79337.1 phosphonate ABC transporter substrate-binding protein [Ureibacillus manganicus DSM 26584]